MRFTTLQDWLAWQETLHPQSIDLGLERVANVYRVLHPQPLSTKIISVAGTNGKGSSIAMLAAIYHHAGYKVATYTSPHLVDYNERICINREPVSDAALCESFARIDAARGDISLTYFEFGTLAALDIFHQQPLDVVILEVGMGGRLDAVNIVDADVALITAIGIDHSDWLGNDRETIGAEKAGIMRARSPAVCSDPQVPDSVRQHANQLGTPLYLIQRDFNYRQRGDSWDWQSQAESQIRLQARHRHSLPRLVLQGAHQYMNAAGVLMVLDILQSSLPVGQADCRAGLLDTQVSGRLQVVSGETLQILDVAHNPQSIQQLANWLQQTPCQGTTRALAGLMKDKDIAACLSPLRDIVDDWYLVRPDVPRAASPVQLKQVVDQFAATGAYCFEQVAEGYTAMCEKASNHDRLVIFGSFYTVSEVMALNKSLSV